MSDADVPVSYGGITPLHAARNGLSPHPLYAKSIGRLINHVLARHGTVIPGMEVLPSAARDNANELRLWTQYYRATPNGTMLVSEVHLLPAVTGSDDPTFYVKVDGVAQATQNAPRGGASTLADVSVRVQEIAVTADAAHQVDLWTNDNCRVVGWYLYEKERTRLTTGDVYADLAGVVPWRPIYDADWASLQAAMVACWQKVRGCYISHNVDDPAAPIVPTTDWHNAWDQNGTHTASTMGATTPTSYRASLMGGTVPVVCWAYGAKTLGQGDITVRFDDSETTIDITIDGGLGLYTATGNLTTSDNKVDVLTKLASGVGGSVYAFGMYPYAGA